MDIVRNKASGKYFIMITDYGDGKGLLVTPQGELKSLELHLFDSPENVDPEKALQKQMVNKNQIDRYNENLEI